MKASTAAGEFALIDKLISLCLADANKLIVPQGHDAAVMLFNNMPVALSVDAIVAGMYFDFACSSTKRGASAEQNEWSKNQRRSAEDDELLFTVPASATEVPGILSGEVATGTGTGVTIMRGGREEPLANRGYDHFALNSISS